MKDDLELRDMAKGLWILTYTGKKVEMPVPSEDSICIEDIAHHLSYVNRFTGATRFPYSVAQHSVYVSNLVPEKDALDALLHDATEAYLGDMNSPLKSLLPEYKKIEGSFWGVISKKFGASKKLPRSVKVADSRAYFMERDAMLPRCGDLLEYAATDEAPIEQISPREAEDMFLKRYQELIKIRREGLNEVDNGKVRPQQSGSSRLA